MGTYRVEIIAKVRENFMVEADDEEQAQQMVLSGSVYSIASERFPEEESEVIVVEEIP